MNICSFDELEREPVFPIYAMLSQDRPIGSSLPGFLPGRVIIDGHKDFETGLMYDDVEEHLLGGDIVFVPLYVSGTSHDWRPPADGTHQKLDCYQHNIDFIRRISPHVGSILIGNIGPEMSFKHLCLYGGESCGVVIDAMCDFVRETGDIIGDAGGIPCYGTIDWDLAIDCYFGDGRFGEAIGEIGAMQICFGGCQLFGVGRHQQIPDEGDICWKVCPRMENPPWPELSKYIRGMKNIISGVEGIAGINRENDVILRDHGFDGGVCGALPLSFMENEI